MVDLAIVGENWMILYSFLLSDFWRLVSYSAQGQESIFIDEWIGHLLCELDM
jgi:hypothetical protein